MPGTKLQEHIGSDKAWVWSTMDFATETQKMELFCIRFASKERAPLLACASARALRICCHSGVEARAFLRTR